MQGAAKKGTRPFTLRELKMFFSTFDVNTKEGRKTRLYFLCQFYLGCRKNQIDRFNVNQIDWEEEIYYVTNDKYSTNRTMPIPYELLYQLRAWYDEDKERIDRYDGYVFYCETKPIPGHSLYQKRFRQHCELAGLSSIYGTNMIGQPMNTLVTHSFRKSYGCWLLDNGCDLFTLKELLGHKTILATQAYIKVAWNRKKWMIKRIFDGKVQPHKIEPLILCHDTPKLEDENSLIDVQLTKKQYDMLNELGVLKVNA